MGIGPGVPGFVSVPPENGGDQFPPVIFNAPLTAATASISTHNLITVPATGTYRISITGETTVLGAGATSTLGYHTVVVGFVPAAGSGTGVVNTSGTAVTWVSGDLFNTQWTGTITINGSTYTISSVGSTTSITLTGSAGTQTSVGYNWHPAAITAALGVLTLGSSTAYNGVLGSTPLTTGPGFYVFRALGGSVITLATTLTAAGGSPAPEPNIVITPVIESLGA